MLAPAAIRTPMKFLLGQKKAMTQIFQDDGVVVPVTVVQAQPNMVLQLRTPDKNGYQAVQLGYGKKSPRRVSKPQTKAWGQAGPFRWVREFRTDTTEGYEPGKTIDVSVFTAGDRVRVTGTSKGRGFAGVVKRHHFSGAPASHGHKHDLRAPGSIGATFPQHVLKGTRMAGRMGNARVTTRNLTVVAVKPETNELLIKGTIPGAQNGLVMIQSL